MTKFEKGGLLFLGAILVLAALGGINEVFRDRTPAEIAKYDAKLVTETISDVAQLAAQTDKSYIKAMDVLSSIGGGKPMYIAADEILHEADIITGTMEMMRSVGTKGKIREINNPEAKRSLRAGINTLFLINRVRRDYIAEVSSSINKGSISQMKKVAAKYKDDLNGLKGKALVSLASFLEAKKAVNLPANLAEFN